MSQSLFFNPDFIFFYSIPVRVAIAPTKCLTKIAYELLKGDERYNDVLDVTRLTDEQMKVCDLVLAWNRMSVKGRKCRL